MLFRLGPISAAALVGTFAGVEALRWLDARRLRKIFAVFVILIGLWMTARHALALTSTS